MRRLQGHFFSVQEIERIKNLLVTTELTFQEIATRMDCSKSSVVTINHTYQIREYRGRRRSWDRPSADGRQCVSEITSSCPLPCAAATEGQTP